MKPNTNPSAVATPKLQCVRLADIDVTDSIQTRQATNADAVAEYAEAMRDTSNRVPPVDLFFDGKWHWIGDGFHRCEAARRNGSTEILANVHDGGRLDALKFALGANTRHGLRRTNADKRRAVGLALKEWPSLSDRHIAELCAVSHPLVAEIRSQLVTVTSCESMPALRIGRDGKSRRLPTWTPESGMHHTGVVRRTNGESIVVLVTPSTAGDYFYITTVCCDHAGQIGDEAEGFVRPVRSDAVGEAVEAMVHTAATQIEWSKSAGESWQFNEYLFTSRQGYVETFILGKGTKAA